MSEYVRLEVADGVGTLRLDRPKMNAIDDKVTAGIVAAADEATARDDVRAVVLYGGERVFAAGADIKQMLAKSPVEMVAWGTGLQDALVRVARIPKPVVAAVTGYALGGGFELALAADFRVLGARAKVGLPEITLGIMPGAGGTQRLSRLIGPARAKELVFSGRHVPADEALALGIADRVVPDDEPGAVYAAARALVEPFVSGPAQAYRAAKRSIDDGLELPLDAALRLETALFTSLWATEDQAAGMTSFVEVGPSKATFTGR